MRLMLVAGTAPPGQCGIGDYVARLAQALSQAGAHVGVLAQQGAELLASPQVEVFGLANRWSVGEGPRLFAAIRRWNPDLVHLHYPSQGFKGRLLPSLLPLACCMAGIRVVQTWHESWPLRGAPRLLLHRAGAHGVVFVRPNYASLLPRSLRPLLRGIPQATIPSAGALPSTLLAPESIRALRESHLKGRRRLVVFFGFLYPSKGVEQLFEIADAASDVIVIAGAAKDPEYLRRLEKAATIHGWPKEQIQYVGYLAEAPAADLLAAADAVVLPFVTGAGDWNTSVHAALAQGTPVITTAAEPGGDDTALNLYTARIGDIAEMRCALDSLAGRRSPPAPMAQQWTRIAQSHLAFYRGAPEPEPRNPSP